MANGRRRRIFGWGMLLSGLAAASGVVASGRLRLVATNGWGFESLQLMKGMVWLVLPAAGGAPRGAPTLTVQDCRPPGAIWLFQPANQLTPSWGWAGWREGRRPADLWGSAPESWQALRVLQVQRSVGSKFQLMVLLWPLVLPWPLIGGVLLAWGVRAGRRVTVLERCGVCGYSRVGMPAETPCPECGAAGPQVAGANPATQGSAPGARSGAC